MGSYRTEYDPNFRVIFVWLPGTKTPAVLVPERLSGLSEEEFAETVRRHLSHCRVTDVPDCLIGLVKCAMQNVDWTVFEPVA